MDGVDGCKSNVLVKYKGGALNLPEELKKELDNYIYLLGGLALVIVLYFIDTQIAGTFAVAMGGAVLTKIKASGSK